MALVLLDDGGGIIVGVERVHQEERHVRAVCSVQVLDLADGEIQKGHTVTNLDDGLGANATHGGTETTVQLQDCQLVQECDGLGVGQVIVVHNLTLGGRCNTIPVTIV